VAVFLATLAVLSAPFYLYLFRAPDPRWGPLQTWGFMWCPGLAALLTRLVVAHGVGGLGWRWGGTARLLLGVLTVPYALCATVYVTVWLLGLGRFDPTRIEELAARLGIAPALLLALVPVLVPLSTALGMAATLGEELGWRGLLAPRLAALAGFVPGSLMVGVVWALWHYPLIIVLLPRFHTGLPLAYAAACFTATLMCLSLVYTWLRLRTGSVWPAVLLHAASARAQELFEGMTASTGPTHYFTFEYGIGFVLVALAVVLVFGRRMSRDAAAVLSGHGNPPAS